jgi:FkbM family methyltransferase
MLRTDHFNRNLIHNLYKIVSRSEFGRPSGQLGVNFMMEKIKSLIRPIIRPALHRVESNLPYLVLGTEYGGWPLLTVRTPPNPMIFSFGVGEDISFDLAAIEQFGATIHAFDPTPRSLKWVSEQSLPDSFHFHPIGIAAEDGEAEFFPPEVSHHVSFSAKPAPRVNQFSAIRAPVRRLSTIMADMGINDIDALKMDIEGFEYDVLDDIMLTGFRPAQIMVEFHHSMYNIQNQTTVDAVSRLKESGYFLYYVSVSGQEYAFVYNGT